MCGRSVAPASGSSTKGIFSFPNIDERSLDCRRKKRNTYDALKWERNAGENILKLEQELESKLYHPSHSLLFAARKPKLREIFAADFRDRVVHHILVHELEKIWEPIFIHDSYACRVDKGTHKAKERLQSFLRKITRNGNVRAYYLQLDVKDFFTSIDKAKLFSLIKAKVTDPDILWLTEKILFWDCTQSYVRRSPETLMSNIPPNKSLFGKNNLKGLPIGNLTSQFFANIYLNELDQFIKHTLKAHYYLRYVDDFVLLSQDRAQLCAWLARIDEFLITRLNLRLHPKRRKLGPVSSGIDFLGYIVRPSYCLVRRRVVNNLRSKLKELKDCPEKLMNAVASYLGHLKHADTFKLTKRILTEISCPG